MTIVDISASEDLNSLPDHLNSLPDHLNSLSDHLNSLSDHVTSISNRLTKLEFITKAEIFILLQIISFLIASTPFIHDHKPFPFLAHCFSPSFFLTPILAIISGFMMYFYWNHLCAKPIPSLIQRNKVLVLSVSFWMVILEIVSMVGEIMNWNWDDSWMAVFDALFTSFHVVAMFMLVVLVVFWMFEEGGIGADEDLEAFIGGFDCNCELVEKNMGGDGNYEVDDNNEVLMGGGDKELSEMEAAQKRLVARASTEEFLACMKSC